MSTTEERKAARVVTARRLVQLLESAGYSVRSYSGRGMYGENCVGVVTDDHAAGVAAQTLAACVDDYSGDEEDETAFREEFRAMALLLGSTRSDSMGRSDSVHYWERAPWDAETMTDSSDSDGDAASEDA